MTLALQLGLGIVESGIVIDRLVGFTDLLGLAEAVDGFEATLWVTEADGLREGWIALEKSCV